jgi:hypothetical protein
MSHLPANALRLLISHAKYPVSEAQNTLDDVGVRLQDVIDAEDVEFPIIDYVDPANIEALAPQGDHVRKQASHMKSLAFPVVFLYNGSIPFQQRMGGPLQVQT